MRAGGIERLTTSGIPLRPSGAGRGIMEWGQRHGGDVDRVARSLDAWGGD
jgi:hypothetical protein